MGKFGKSARSSTATWIPDPAGKQTSTINRSTWRSCRPEKSEVFLLPRPACNVWYPCRRSRRHTRFKTLNSSSRTRMVFILSPLIQPRLPNNVFSRLPCPLGTSLLGIDLVDPSPRKYQYVCKPLPLMYRCLKWAMARSPQLKEGLMNVHQLIWELRNERSRLDEAILALERLCPNGRGNRRIGLAARAREARPATARRSPGFQTMRCGGSGKPLTPDMIAFIDQSRHWNGCRTTRAREWIRVMEAFSAAVPNGARHPDWKSSCSPAPWIVPRRPIERLRAGTTPPRARRYVPNMPA